MSATVPLKVIVASAVPSPVVKTHALVAREIDRAVGAVSVTLMGLLPASRSLTLSCVPVALENSTMPLTSVACAAGTVLTGATLM